MSDWIKVLVKSLLNIGIIIEKKVKFANNWSDYDKIVYHSLFEILLIHSIKRLLPQPFLPQNVEGV